MNRSSGTLLKVIALVLFLAEVGIFGVPALMRWAQGRTIRQAQALLMEATSTPSGGIYFSNRPQATAAELDARIPKLEAALKMNPGLTEAHFWLGQYGLDRLAMPNASTTTLSFVTCLSELKTYIRDTPNDQKAYSLSLSSVWESRAPGALREKAWHTLIWNACKLCPKPATSIGVLALPKSWNDASNRVFEAFRDHYVALVTKYLSEPPRKNLTDHLHHIPPMFMRPPLAREPQKVIAWYRFIDSVYGADHPAYNVPCPYEDCARALDYMEETNLARAVRESPERTHCRDQTPAPAAPPGGPGKGDGSTVEPKRGG